MKKLLLVVLVLTVSACAQKEIRKSTETWPQVMINAPADKVRTLMVSKLAQGKMTLTQSDQNIIRGEAVETGLRASLLQASFGCAACAPPKAIVQFIITGYESQTTITAQYWTEVPHYNGTSERVEESGDNAAYNRMLEALQRLKTAAEQGS